MSTYNFAVVNWLSLPSLTNKRSVPSSTNKTLWTLSRASRLSSAWTEAQKSGSGSPGQTAIKKQSNFSLPNSCGSRCAAVTDKNSLERRSSSHQTRYILSNTVARYGQTLVTWSIATLTLWSNGQKRSIRIDSRNQPGADWDLSTTRRTMQTTKHHAVTGLLHLLRDHHRYQTVMSTP